PATKPKTTRTEIMDAQRKEIARDVAASAADGTRDFGQIVGTLMESGFDGYLVDYRAATQAFYLPDGSSHVVDIHRPETPVAATFDAAAVREAIREAQTKAVGYTYLGFGEKVARAGCAGYLVTFSGKRVLYFGRDGQTHTEFFPGAGPVATD
ncbi:MAG: DUF1398 family protein, partial [Fibrobacterota bacterium]